ncbi:hypothetical protein MAALD49_30020 [Marinobacter shengliensis]|nr:hypothetical protein MAALD49_30020 [Marinobacter shengliensis]
MTKNPVKRHDGPGFRSDILVVIQRPEGLATGTLTGRRDSRTKAAVVNGYTLLLYAGALEGSVRLITP